MRSRRKSRWQRRRRKAKLTLCRFPLSFGRYRNLPLSKVPVDYLHWMLTAENTPYADRWAAKQYLDLVTESRRRPGRPQESTTPTVAPVGAGL